MQFPSLRQMLGIKLETTPYTAVELGKADFNVHFENVRVTNVIDKNERRYAIGEVSTLTSIPAGFRVEFTADMPLVGSGDPDAPPPQGKVWRMCGFEQVIVPTAGYNPGGVIYQRTTRPVHRCPATVMWVGIGGRADDGAGVIEDEAALAITAKGCMADGELKFDRAGGFWKLAVRIQGELVDVEDLDDVDDIIGGSGYSQEIPPVLMGANVLLGDTELTTNTLTLTLGNVVVMVPDIKAGRGFLGAAISDFVSRWSATPYMAPVGDDAFWAAIESGTPAHLQAWAGDVADLGNFIKIDAFAAQIEDGYTPEDREGFSGNPLSGPLTDATPAVLAITYGSYVGAEGYPATLIPEA